MKFLVDEMPFWESDCPFYDQYEGTCRLDDCGCEYMEPSAGNRCEEDCRWLKTVSARRGNSDKRYTRPVVRVDDKTGEVVRFCSIKEAKDSIGGNSISMELMTHRPLKGYRFYYEEDWKDGE